MKAVPYLKCYPHRSVYNDIKHPHTIKRSYIVIIPSQHPHTSKLQSDTFLRNSRRTTTVLRHFLSPTPKNNTTHAPEKHPQHHPPPISNCILATPVHCRARRAMPGPPTHRRARTPTGTKGKADAISLARQLKTPCMLAGGPRKTVCYIHTFT